MGMFEEPPVITDEDLERFEGMTDDEIIEAMELDIQKNGEVDKLYREVENMTFPQMAHLMNETRIKYEAVKRIKTALQIRYDALRLNIIPSAMDDDAISNITIEGIGRITLTSDMHCSIPKDQRASAWKWLRDNNHDIVQETVNSSTLKATLKAIIKAGKETIPEGLFKVLPFTRASITKK